MSTPPAAAPTPAFLEYALGFLGITFETGKEPDGTDRLDFTVPRDALDKIEFFLVRVIPGVPTLGLRDAAEKVQSLHLTGSVAGEPPACGRGVICIRLTD